jgi:hypothetical protein
LCVAHLGLAGLTAWHWRRHQTGRVLGKLAPALIASFLMVAVNSALEVRCEEATVAGWWTTLRTLATAVVVAPLLWYGLRALAELPTKEEAARLAADAVAARRVAEAALAAESVAKRKALDMARTVARELNVMREDMEHLRQRDDVRAEVERMIHSTHEIRNALPSVLSR